MTLLFPRNVSNRRIWIARGIAVAADAVEFVLPMALAEGILSPFEAGLDVVTAVVLTLLIGWHIAFVPSFVVKALPIADIAPTWTIAVLIATRKGATGTPGPVPQVQKE